MQSKLIYFIACALLFLQCSQVIYAQTPDSVSFQLQSLATKSKYTISGIVKDKHTGERIPFATIFFPNSGIGTPSDTDGKFLLKLDELPSDTLRFQALGYKTLDKDLPRGITSILLIIELEQNENLINEVVISASGEDPAITLMKKVIQHKPKNNPDRLNNYKYEVYNKLEIDLQRLSKEQFEKLPVPMLKKFSFIYQNLDTISENRPFLPIYLTETLSDYYYQKEPKKTKEYIKASLLKGIKYDGVIKFLGSMYQNINPYDNSIPVLDKKFISPLNNAALFFYHYQIIDTVYEYGYPLIHLKYAPRRQGEFCFMGELWIADSVYALQKIKMELPPKTKLNWVNNMNLYQEYEPIDSIWFCVKDKYMVDFVPPYKVENLPGFVGRKTTSYDKIVINDASIPQTINSKTFKADIVVDEEARNRSEDYWQNNRHDTLNQNEQAIYAMIDTLEEMPSFNKFKNLVKFFASGVKEFGPIELGPYWYLYSSNPIEGARFRFTMGTTPKLFKDIYLNGYVAYGTQDERFKYFASGLWLLDRKPRMYIYGSYTYDLDRSTNSFNAISSTDNIFSVAARKSSIPWKLAFQEEVRTEFYKEYFSGFSHMLMLQHKRFDPYAPLPEANIFTDENGNPSASVINAEVNLKLRFAYKERFLEGNYLRMSLGSKNPIAEVQYARGLKGIIHSGYDYHRVTAGVSDNIDIAPLGSLYINVYGGKIFGTLPYPLLQIHAGNEFYYYNRNAFNMMNQYEFLSDRYAGINIEHSIGTGIFKYIPLLKKTKFRQFWTAKAVIGDLSDANTALNLNKGYEFKTLQNNPYIEVGTGIENILQFFRIDFVWRVAPQRQQGEPQSRYFGIFGSVKFNF